MTIIYYKGIETRKGYNNMSEETKQILGFFAAATVAIISMSSCTVIQDYNSGITKQFEHQADKARYENNCAEKGHTHTFQSGKQNPWKGE